MQCVLLAYASDMFMLATALRPHRAAFRRGPRLASLDHTIWFHTSARTDDWLLFRQISPWAGNGRGLAFGSICNRSGRPVATVAQEGLMRLSGHTAAPGQGEAITAS